MIKKHSQQKGFVALFAVLLAMIILSISIGIATISYKEVVLSSSAREANGAFFTADSGAECMLFHDLKQGSFTIQNAFADISCFGKDPGEAFQFAPIEYDNEGIEDSYAFGYQFDLVDSCARIELHKQVEINGTYYTKIESKGYNMSCTEKDNITPGTAQASRLVERAVRATYPERSAIPPITP